jgi:hypothetical protein
VIKYKRNAYYAYQRQQTLPVNPTADTNPAFILGGALGRFTTHLQKNDPLNFEVWLGTVQNGWAKGCPRPDKTMMDQTKLDTFNILTTPAHPPDGTWVPNAFRNSVEVKDEAKKILIDALVRPGTQKGDWFHYYEVPQWGRELSLPSWDDEEDTKVEYIPRGLHEVTELYTRDVILQLRRTVFEVFEGEAPMTLKERLALFMPGTSATYNTSRSGAGPLGEILNDEELLDGLRSIGGCLDLQVFHKTSRLEKSREYKEDRVVGIITEVYEAIAPYEPDDTIDPSVRNELSLKNRKELRRRFKILWGRILSRAEQEPNDVTLVALAEALKVRVITKSGAARTTFLTNFQKWMHRRMRLIPFFKLIGEPISAEYLQDRLGLNDKPLGPTEEFGSGDYTQATNKMYSIISEALGGGVCDVMIVSPTERKLFLDHLTGHYIEHPETKELKKQERGQLMGSIISFPILCLANATIVRMSYELATGRYWKLNDIPACVNGDDVVWRGPREVYNVWKIVADFFGMSESIGKTFQSREFVQMNSVNFEYEDGNLRETPFINWGLLKGMTRSGGADTGIEENTIESSPSLKYRELMRLSPPHLRNKLHKIYVAENKTMLARVHVPWYIPTWLGGLGLTGVKEPSDQDLKIANFFIRRIGNKRTLGAREPIPQDSAKPVKSWVMRDLAIKELPPPFYTFEENSGVESYENAIFQESINKIFDNTISLKDLFPTTNEYIDATTGETVFVEKKDRPSGLVSRAMKHNSRLWSKAQKGNNHYAPIKYRGADLEKFKVYESYVDRFDPNYERWLDNL